MHGTPRSQRPPSPHRFARSFASFDQVKIGLLQSVGYRYPEWWSIASSAAAWAVLVLQGHHAAAGAGFILTWLLMVLAMMVPLQRFAIRVTATRSLWGRRDRAIAGFMFGYLSPWLLVGVGVAGIEPTLARVNWLGGVGFAVAAVWQLTPAKARALRACHRTIPLAPTGWRADRDCFRFGWLSGGQCLLSCWALMLACLLAGHSLIAMACVTLVGVAERYIFRPRQQATVSPLLGVALVYGILGLSALPFG